MTCREFADFMMDYLSEELPPESRRVFEHHLAHCGNCLQYLASYEESVSLGKRAFDEDEDAPVSPTVPDALVKAILVARAHRR